MEGLPLGSSEDKELALAFKRGEKGAYQAIYERHSARVQGVCRRMLLSPDDAAEASQETFLKVFQALDRFNGRYQLGAWITRIATNVCLDHLRASARRPTLWAPVEELDEKDLPRRVALEEEPEAFVIRKTEGRRVYRVLRSLPPMHRAAIVLRDFEGLPYAEIALALDMTEPQVKALLHRARCGFKKSWSTTGLAAFLPWNLLDRLRRPDTILVDQAQAAASSASQVAQVAGPTANAAVSCSMALQQCGQVLTERFATTMTALIVGTAAISSGVASSSPAPSTDAVTDRSQEKAAPIIIEAAKSVKESPEKRAEDRSGSPEMAPAPVPEPDKPAPVKEPEPAATPPGSSGGGGDGSNDPEPAPQPTYAPVAPAIGWERGSPLTPTMPTVNSIKLDCATSSLDQHLETVIQNGSETYPAIVDLTMRTGSQLAITFVKGDTEYKYDGGSPSVAVTGSGRNVTWSSSGSYSYVGLYPPSEAGLPGYGRFTLTLELDCTAGVLIQEIVSLSY